MDVTLQNVTKRIGGTVVLDHVSLSMVGGRVYGFQGINGSGKTMLMRAVCGLLRPTEGTVFIDGQALGESLSFPPSVGALIEGPSFLPGYTGMRNLLLLARLRGVAGECEVHEALSRVGLDPDDRRKYRKYSLGMKQRLGIAGAIFEDPDLVVLDEPFNALDADGCDLVRSLVRELAESGKLVMLASHSAEDLESLSDEVLRMESGRILRTHETEG